MGRPHTRAPTPAGSVQAAERPFEGGSVGLLVPPPSLVRGVAPAALDAHHKAGGGEWGARWARAGMARVGGSSGGGGGRRWRIGAKRRLAKQLETII